MNNKVCSVCEHHPENIVTLTDTRTVINACIHRVPGLVAYNGFQKFGKIDMKSVKAVLEYARLRDNGG